MRLFSDDAVFVRAAPRVIIDALTRLSVDQSWWPGARATGAYGWVRARVPADVLGPVTFRATIGPVREWEGFSWELTEGELTGRAEWWLAEHGEGAVLHHLLDAAANRRWMPAATAHRRYRWAIRRGMNGLKDHLERGAAP